VRKFIFSETVWGLALTLAATFFYFTGTGLETAELKFYDFRARLSAQAPDNNAIAVIEINDDSISKIGRWPWSRSKIADMLVWLSSAPARPSVIGLNILFPEPEKNGDAALADLLKEKYAALVAAKKIRETGKGPGFLQEIDQARSSMDNDARLADAISGAGTVVLPLYFATGAPVAKIQQAPDWLKRFVPSVAHGAEPVDIPVEASDMTLPLEVLASSAAGVGHVNVFNDMDGAVRREYPYIPYGHNFYPSFATEIVRVSLGLGPGSQTFSPGHSASFGKRVMPLDSSSSAAGVLQDLFFLRRTEQQDRAGGVQGQDRADRPYRPGRRQPVRDPDQQRHARRILHGQYSQQHPLRPFRLTAGMGAAGGTWPYTLVGPLHHLPAAAPESRDRRRAGRPAADGPDNFRHLLLRR
jgi:CHASE2 domain-containing sensor protein